MSVIKSGIDAIKNASVGGSSNFLRVEADSTVKIVPMVGLDKMAIINQHFMRINGKNVSFACVAEEDDCPGCKVGGRPNFRAFLPVLVKQDDQERVLIWSFGIQIAKTLLSISEAMEDNLAGSVISLRRDGTGKSTRWTPVATGKKKDISDVEMPFELENEIGPLTRSSILSALYTAGYEMTGLWTEEEKTQITATASAPETKSEKDDDWD